MSDPRSEVGPVLLLRGRHVAVDALVVEVEATGAVWLAFAEPGPGRVGPVSTLRGVRWLAPSWAGATVWEIVVAHPEGLGESVVVAGLRALLAGGARRVDPDASWVDEAGEARRIEGPGSLSALARYLLRGELAHAAAEAEPSWVERLDADAAAALAALPGDLEGWRAAARRAAHALVEPMPGERIAPIAGPGSDASTPVGSPPARVRVARTAVLTLLLGVVAGGLVGRATGATVEIVAPGAIAITASCADTRHESAEPRLLLPSRPVVCRVEVRAGDVVAATALDMARGGRYECRVVGEEVACDGP